MSLKKFSKSLRKKRKAPKSAAGGADSYKLTFKVAVLGPLGVGKTSILDKIQQELVPREANQDQYATKIVEDGEIDVYEIAVHYDDIDLCLQIHDMSSRDQCGLHRERTFSRTITSADAFIIVFSLADKQTLGYLQQFQQRMKQIKRRDLDSLPIVVVGNKRDLFEEREISQDDVMKDYVIAMDCPYVELSAKHDNNLFRVVEELCDELSISGRIYEKVQQEQCKQAIREICHSKILADTAYTCDESAIVNPHNAVGVIWVTRTSTFSPPQMTSLGYRLKRYNTTAIQRRLNIVFVPCGIIARNICHDAGCKAKNSAISNEFSELEGEHNTRLTKMAATEEQRAYLETMQKCFQDNSRTKDFVGHSAKVHSVAWNCNGRYLASGSFDKTVSIFNLDKDRLIRESNMKGHSDSVDQLCWHPSHPDLLVTASGDKTIRIWDARSNVLLILHACDFCFIFALQASGKCTEVVSTKGENINICWSPDGNTIAVGNKEDLITFVDTRTFRIKAEEQFKFEHVFKQYNYLHLLSYPDLKFIHTLNAHPANCICIKFDPKGRYFATGSADALVSLWDLEELACVRTFSRLDWPVRTLGFSHDGKMLASASEDLFIDIAMVETGERICEVNCIAPTFTVAWHPNKYLLAFACDDKDKHDRDAGTVRLFGREMISKAMFMALKTWVKGRCKYMCKSWFLAVFTLQVVLQEASGLQASIVLILCLVVARSFAFSRKLTSNKIPEGLSSTLKRKSNNLLIKVLKTKIDFAIKRGISENKLGTFDLRSIEKGFIQQQCGKGLVKFITSLQSLFDQSQKMQLLESEITRSEKKNFKVYLKDFRHIEFKLRELESKVRKFSKTFGRYQVSELPGYSVGLGPKTLSTKSGKTLSKEEVNLINFKQLENIQKCLETPRFGKGVESDYNNQVVRVYDLLKIYSFNRKNVKTSDCRQGGWRLYWKAVL
eukprot:gene15920-17521_t